MVMEFRIAEVMERFRTLKMYEQQIETEKWEEVAGL